ncbi:MAG: ATP-binding cassette domain-containing protein [Spirochaetia bacterium]|nr:ATP-binding cassette domain-containing protein [Spirochaetia bacterium]
MIHLQHVTVRRQNRLILDDISLDIEDGEHTAVIGPNGSGKSTLVNVITRDVHPIQREGLEMSFFGQSRPNVFELRKQIGIVSDRLALLCRTSYRAEDIVLSGFFSSIGISFNHQVTEPMVTLSRKLMTFMEVSHLADKPMNSLSTGEAQRVLIARALVHEPKALILDEPVSNLDLRTQRQFKQTVRAIADQGRTLLMITHDLSEIIPEIDHLIILKEGRIIARGDKRELLNAKLLSEVYDTKVYVDSHDGWFKAWC